MKLAIDSYCYHRYFGEVYPGLETDPGGSMTLESFIERASSHGVEGVSLESFMLKDSSANYLEGLRRGLEKAALGCVWAWGHPRGLGSGLEPAALKDLMRHVEIAHAVDARVMRICAGGRKTRTLTWQEHKSLLLPLLLKAADHAAKHDMVLAIENHIDFFADELVDLLETAAHPALGVCLDTANNLRMLEDPSRAITKLAPYARTVHLKDVTAFRGSPLDFGFWPSVPVGQGLIDVPLALHELQRAGFDGLLAIEIDFLHPRFVSEDSAISQSVDYVRGLLSRRSSSGSVAEVA